MNEILTGSFSQNENGEEQTRSVIKDGTVLILLKEEANQVEYVRLRNVLNKEMLKESENTRDSVTIRDICVQIEGNDKIVKIGKIPMTLSNLYLLKDLFYSRGVSVMEYLESEHKWDEINEGSLVGTIRVQPGSRDYGIN